MSFFPAFVNGPLVSFGDFHRRRLAGYWETAPRVGLVGAEARALGRIALGIALALLAYASVCNLDHGYAAAMRGRPAVAWAHTFRTYACWYVSFSGWTEAAIGFGLLAGIALPENFNAPHLAYSPADFWRRWNMSLQVWLRNYVYLPLGGLYVRGSRGVRHLEWRNTIAVFTVMTAYHLFGALKLFGPKMLVGPWWVPWTLWGAMNAVGVLATRRFSVRPGPGISAVVVVALTFVFVCVGFMTAPFPPTMPLAALGVIYQKLFLFR
jgi:alginate O-acetyltransferase complex protein AlgI